MGKNPDWLKIKAVNIKNVEEFKKLLETNKIDTVCESACCPNRFTCYSKKVATFMILGKICTRNCSFCNVSKGKPLPLDIDEPERIVKITEILKLKHIVITSVTRDDLCDGGALQFAEIIRKIKIFNPQITVEVLIPDFNNNLQALDEIVFSKSDIIGHNLETVPRLYPKVRPQADYKSSLEILNRIKSVEANMLTKSGLMVGLGECKEEVVKVMQDLRNAQCDILTIGQYLRPSPKQLKVFGFVTPEQFEEYNTIAYNLGFRAVACGPLVRSSLNTESLVKDALRLKH